MPNFDYVRPRWFGLALLPLDSQFNNHLIRQPEVQNVVNVVGESTHMFAARPERQRRPIQSIEVLYELGFHDGCAQTATKGRINKGDREGEADYLGRHLRLLGLGQVWPDVLVIMRAQVSAGNRTIRGALDSEAAFSRNGATEIAPLTDENRRDAKGPCDRCGGFAFRFGEVFAELHVVNDSVTRTD